MRRIKLVIIGVAMSFFSVAQEITVEVNSGNPKFPFPQFLPYEAEGGHKLDNLATNNAPGVTHAEMEKRIREAWQIMANGFDYTGETHQSLKYIYSNIGCPYDCSEGVGYGMIAAAYMADKNTFDGIWFREHDVRMVKEPRYIDGIVPRPNYKYGKYTLAEPLPLQPGTSGVEIGEDGGDAATDGDVDIALGLLMAWRQWGDQTGYSWPDGTPISYKEEALKVIRGLVERQNQELDPNRFDCRSISGNVGFDGYFKNGNTWNELTDWASNDPVWCPEYKGPTPLHVDYVAPAYFGHFAQFLQEEGGNDPEDTDWNISQLLRAEASSDWLVGQHYSNSNTSILSAGWVSLDSIPGKAVFWNFNQGEDFRFAWRTALNYVWDGNPTTSWNPNTHQVEPGGNTFEKDMAIRHAKFLKNPGEAPWTNACVDEAIGGGPDLSYMGPSQLMWYYSPDGVDSTGGNGFPLNWNSGTGAPSAVSAQDFELMGKLYHMCAIEWDIDTPGDGYLTSDPVYFHGFFRLLGMMILSGNHHSPYGYELESNMKVYLDNDKTYAFTGDLVNFTIDYRNYASIDAAGVKITTTLPIGLEYISNTGGATVSGNTLEWNIGSVPGFQTGTGVTPTTGQVTFTARVSPNFSGQICPVAEITTTNGKGWTSNEYPNNVTAVMERNCIDIVEKALEIDKSVNYDKVNPGTELIYDVNFENASSGGFINGGRPGVIPAYAHSGTAAEGQEHWIKFRLYHGAAEPYIDYQNYRLSLFLNDNVNTCAVGTDPTCTNGWELGSNGSAAIYEGGDPSGVRVFQEDITPGTDARGSWNQRFVVQFSEQIATSTPHLSRYFGIVGQRVHQGGGEPLRAVWQMHSNPWSTIKWDDDWSWNPALADEDDGLFYPVANDWTDINNPDQPVTDWHNEACEKPTVFADNVLVEEWDGYTWRRIYGNGPLPGRDVENVIVKDVIPEGFTFVGFVDQNGALIGNNATILGEEAQYDATTRTITWTKDKLQVKQGGTIRYKVVADFSTGSCNRADEIQINTASIEGDNESPVVATAEVTITCDDIILPPPPSSMTKTADNSAYDVGDQVTYTLEYENTNGSIIDADLTGQTNWTAQSGQLMNVSAGELSTVSNNDGVTTYDYSHGTNGTIEAQVNFQGSAAFGFAFRHTGGGKANGQYVVFKPNPGNGSTEIRVYDGNTELATATSSFPNTPPATIKLELVDDQVNVWIGNTSNPTPTLTFTGFTVKAGYAGFVNGWVDSGGDSYGTHRVVRFNTHLDSGFDLEISDPLPSTLSFVSSVDGGTLVGSDVVFPTIPGPVLAGEKISYQWIAEVDNCPTNQKIVNNAYTNILGQPTNSIASQVIVDCGDIVTTCTAPTSITITGDSVTCEGTAIQLAPTVTSTATLDEYYYTWLDKTGAVVSGPSTSITDLELTGITAADTGRYTLRIEDGDNNDASCYVEKTIPVNMTVKPFNLQLTSIVDTAVCPNTSQTVAITADSATTYEWTIDGTVDTETNSSITIPVGDGTQNRLPISVKAINACGETASIDTAIYVKPTCDECTPPTTAEILTTEDTLCSGSTLTLEANAESGYEYTWVDLTSGSPVVLNGSGTGQIADDIDQEITTGGTFAVYIAEAGYSTDPTCVKADTITIDEITSPGGTLTFDGSEDICPGDTGTYTITPLLTDATDYTWELPAGAVFITDTTGPNTNTVEIDFATTTGGDIIVTATNQCGEGSSTTKTINISTKPATPVITGYTHEAIDSSCVGSTVNLEATGATNYSWNSSEGNTSTTDAFSFTMPDTETWISVKTIGNCGESDSVTITLRPQDKPTISALSGAESSCTGAVETFRVTGDANANSFTWTVTGATPVADSDADTIAVTFGTTDATIEVVATNTLCGDSDPKTTTVTITTNVVPSITLTQVDTTCEGGDVTFRADVSGEGTNYDIEWFENSTSEQTGTGKNYTVTGAQNTDEVYAILTSDLSCVDPTEKEQTSSTETVAVDLPAEAALLTNPTNETITICSDTYTGITAQAAANGSWLTPSNADLTNETTTSTDVENIPDNDPVKVVWEVTSDKGLCPAERDSVTITKAGDITAEINPVAFDTLCLNSTETLTTNGQPGETHEWKQVGGTGTVTIANPNDATTNITATTAGTITLQYKRTSAGGCTDSIETPTFTVFEANDNLTFTPETTEACEGETITAKVDNPETGYIYEWTLGPGGNGTLKNITGETNEITLGNTTSENIRVTKKHPTCPLASPNTKQTFIFIKQKPQPAGTTLSGATQPCPNTTQTYSIPAVPETDNYRWVYTPSANDWNTSGAGATITAAVGTDDVNITVYAVNECTTADGILIDNIDVDVQNATNPRVTIDYNDVTYCEGDEIFFTANVADVSATNYTWYIDNTEEQNGPAKVFSDQTIQQDQTVRVEVTYENCDGTISSTPLTDQVTPTQNIKPNPGITYNGETIIGTPTDKDICEGTPLMLSTNAQPGDAITWTTPQESYTTATVEIDQLTQSDAGIYTVSQEREACGKVTSTVSLNLNVIKQPTINFVSEEGAPTDAYIYNIEETPLVYLRGNGLAEGTITFNPGNMNEQNLSNTNASYLVTQTIEEKTVKYIVTLEIAENQTKCTSQDEATVLIIESLNPPTAFTPNGDGVNDTWIIPGMEKYPKAVVRIYNRWGQELYHHQGNYNSHPWDGRGPNGYVPLATYYYGIDLNDESAAESQITGTVTILK